MSSPSLSHRYANRYPGQGKIVLLCEGDLAGYEADLFARMTSQYGYVDIIPCGTKSSILGMCDAVGRAISVIAIEDRDYRTPEQAARDCAQNLKERKKRDVQIHSWRAWQRNEIENYLIEPSVAVPTLAKAFCTKPDDVEDRLARVLPCLAVDQASQWAIELFQSGLPDRYRYRPGLPHQTARPAWVDKDPPVAAPALEEVRNQLRGEFEAKAKQFSSKIASVDVDDLIQQFDMKSNLWPGATIGSECWRVEWSGKDVLASLCRWLAADFGWPIDDASERRQVNWATLVANRRDSELDREIAMVLQPYLVDQFCSSFDHNANQAIGQEWTAFIEDIKRALDT